MASILLIDLSTMIFGITALLLASRARSRLSPGSLRAYIDNFSVCLSFIVMFTVWRLARDFSGVSEGVEGALLYPEYFFIVGAYIAFIIASYRIIRISHEFGFQSEKSSIEKVLQEKRK